MRQKWPQPREGRMVEIMWKVTFTLPLSLPLPLSLQSYVAITMVSLSLIPGDLGDQSLSEDEDEGVEAEKSR